MSKFESQVKLVPYPQEVVYGTLSDLTNVGKIKEKMKDDRFMDFTFDADSISVKLPPVGEVSMRIVGRDEPKTIKFESVNSPLDFNFWIQLLPEDDSTSKMKLTLKADIPFVFHTMAKGPLQDGMEKIADALAAIPYDSLHRIP